MNNILSTFIIAIHSESFLGESEDVATSVITKVMVDLT